MPLPFEWFNYNVLKNFAAVEIKGETRIKTHTIPLLKPTAKQNVLRKRRIVFSACAFFLLTQYTAIKICWNCNLRKIPLQLSAQNNEILQLQVACQCICRRGSIIAENNLRKRRIAFLAGAFFLLTQYTAIKFC